MKVAVVYNSLTGCTKKVAEAIYAGLDNIANFSDMEKVEKDIFDFTENPNLSAYDYVVLGFYVAQANMDLDLLMWLPNLKGKKVFVYCTMSTFADSEHAYRSIKNGVTSLEAAHAEVIGNFVCNGALAPHIVERFKLMINEHSGNSVVDHNAYTPEKGLRYELFKDHPTPAECALASERCNERIVLSERIKNLSK